MPSFFPRQTIELHLEEPRAFRRLSFSLVEMGLITGFGFRVFRSFAFSHGSNGFWYLAASIAFAAVLLLGMATAHLANYPIHRWVWRAPLFVAVESVGEMITSLLLLGIGREPYGTRRAELSDWPAMAAGTLLTRGVAVILWALILAAVVAFVRRTIVTEEPEPEDAPNT